MSTAKLEIDEVEMGVATLRGLRLTIDVDSASELPHQAPVPRHCETAASSDTSMLRRCWNRVWTWLVALMRLLVELGFGGG